MTAFMTVCPELTYVRPGERRAVAIMFQDASGGRHAVELTATRALRLAAEMIRLAVLDMEAGNDGRRDYREHRENGECHRR